jgi:hypothetical protein
MVVLDFRNLTRGELIAGLSGVALFVIMLAVDWYGINVLLIAEGDPDPDVVRFGGGLNWVEALTRNAFEAFTVIDLVLLLTALAAVALPLWSALGRPATGPAAICRCGTRSVLRVRMRRRLLGSGWKPPERPWPLGSLRPCASPPPASALLPGAIPDGIGDLTAGVGGTGNDADPLDLRLGGEVIEALRLRPHLRRARTLSPR